MNLFILKQDQIQSVQLDGLTVLGGRCGTGLYFEHLKDDDDYAIVNFDGTCLTVHSLKGKHKSRLQLSEGEIGTVGDLKFFWLGSKRDSENSESRLTATQFLFTSKKFLEILRSFSDREDLELAMGDLLEMLIGHLELEIGFVIQQDTKGEFQLTIERGIKGHAGLLSETFLKSVLASDTPVLVQNLVGSKFSRSESLMATGFISVFGWPLVVRGKVLGALVVGSRFPHSGLQQTQIAEASIVAQVAALLLQFHLKERAAREEIALLRKGSQNSQWPLTTQNPRLLKTLQLGRSIAETPLSILIIGETGSGKERLARWLHDLGRESDKPFVSVNCGAIPENLIESLLFGHKKGAFTGAHQDQIGKFQQAQGGTLFLDEIGELPLNLQVKLLRALQERMIEPVGSQRPIPVDVRVVAATHQPIAEMTKTGRFRADLYYRIAELYLEIPPLRDRASDIPLIAVEMLKEISPNKHFSSEAWSWLKSQRWEGNSRELQSAVRRGALVSRKEEIEIEDLLTGVPIEQNQSQSWLGGENLDEARDNFVFSKVKEALRHVNGHRGQAAELLGVTPRTLFRYIEEMRDKKIFTVDSTTEH